MAVSIHLTLKQIENELKEVTAANWYPLGVQLGLRPAKLREIESNNARDAQRCKLDILDWWLENAPVTSWEELANAVEGMGGHSNVVQKLRRKMSQVPQESVTQRTPLQGETERQKSHGETSPPLYLDSVASGHQEPLRRIASGHQEPSKAAVFARENRQAIKDKFAAFQTNVCSKLLKSGVDTEEFRLHVINQFPPGKCIPPPPANLTEMFKAITYHGLWDYFHYSPLVRIAKRFGAGDPEIESWVQTYKKDVKAYSVVAKLEDYVESDVDVTAPQPANRAKYDPHYYTQVEWKTEFIDHSLQYLTEVWELFSSHYLMPDSPPTALLHRIYEGCFSVTWLVPSGLIPQLIKSTKSDSAFYQQHRILRVTVRDECIYEEETTLDPKQLFQACEQGDLEVVHRFLAAGIDVEIKDARNWTPLYITSWKGHDKIVTQLLKRGADVNCQDEFGQAPLWTASLHGHSHIVELLLASGANPDVQKEDGASPLYAAAQEGHSDVCRVLIEQGANINSQNKDGASPLYVAAQEGHVDVCRLLIAQGANINSQKKDGFSALHISCQEGHPQVVELLLQAGASMEQESEDNQTPLYIACKEGRNQIVELLLRRKADVNHQAKDGTSPLYMAAQEGHMDVCRLLIEQGANINSQDEEILTEHQGVRLRTAMMTDVPVVKVNGDGFTALYSASFEGYTGIVESLLLAGANPDIQRKDGFSALHISCQEGHPQVVELLLQAGASLEQETKDNQTPLYIACKEGHDQIVELLLRRKADVNHQEENGASPLYVASQEGHLGVCRLLIEQGANINSQTKDHFTALVVASYQGHSAVVEKLLEAGANPDIQDDIGRTALIFASQQGHSSTVLLLAEGRTQLNLRNQEGRTALALASWEGHLSVVQVLVSKGADPNIQDEEGLTALILAVKQGHTEVVKELVYHGRADVNIFEKSTQWTALFFAAKDGNLDMTRLLIQGGANICLKDKSEVTALDVAKVFNHEDVIQELTSQISSVRQDEGQRTIMEMKELVLSARKFLQTMFSRVERSILKTRTLKREMAENISQSTHDEPKTIHIRSDK